MSYREEFDMYGVAEPEEPWGYNMDDYGVIYGPRDWPFWKIDGGNQVPGLPKVEETRAPATILWLAPDTAFQSWHQARMMVFRTPRGGYELHFGWTIRPHGLGWHVALVTVHLTESCGIRNWNDFKGDAMKKVRARVDTFKAFLKQHREARDRDEERPVTAHELYERSKRNVELG
jgi:hypothetical protein